MCLAFLLTETSIILLIYSNLWEFVKIMSIFSAKKCFEIVLFYQGGGGYGGGGYGGGGSGGGGYGGGRFFTNNLRPDIQKMYR